MYRALLNVESMLVVHSHAAALWPGLCPAGFVSPQVNVASTVASATVVGDQHAYCDLLQQAVPVIARSFDISCFYINKGLLASF